MTVIQTPRKQTSPYGKLATDPEDIRLCPRCGETMHAPFISRSRIYKHTSICPDCGQAEAVLQLAGKDATWQPVIYEWKLTIERHNNEVHELELDIESLGKDYENLQAERDQYRNTTRQLREENKKFSERSQKNREVIHQLTEKIKFMDQQIKDLLANMLHTEDT